jgi:hypothetical protein
MNITDFTNAVGDRQAHLRYALAHAGEGMVCEFGVQRAVTLNAIADMVAPRHAWGFDSFQGLPEEWRKNAMNLTPKGAMAQKVMPIIRDNVTLVVGWFAETLPKWLKQHAGPIAFAHIDCDLYSSASCVLQNIASRLVAGSVLVFDELYNWDWPQNYTEWAKHEWRALQELLDSGIRLKPLARTTGHSAGSVIVE